MRVLVTYRIPEVGLKALRERFEVDLNEEERLLTKEELLERIRDVDGVVTMLADPVDKEFIDAGKKLKVIANYAVGYNNIDVGYATQKGIYVTHTPGAMTNAVAEVTLALMLAVSRRIVEADKYVRAGKFKGWKPGLFLGPGLAGKTLGIIGLGRIGRAVARRAKSFNMKVLYYSRTRLPEDLEGDLGVKYMPLEDLLKESDFVTLHVPLTQETHHLLDERRLFMMKKGAFLINASRGPVVDEKALVKALKAGHLGGAGLDVYEREPQIEPELLEMDNVVLLPHIGAASSDAMDRMAIMVADCVIKALSGEKPVYLVPEQKKVFGS
ncbi:MAG: D-glycerate dehydrogenase [Synergistetes bacterium]|nr:D-glycerate dehydrogenase [Synergistota bacterium]MDW8191687.1 D-glycerate dehydrogenase [Synergistota bacterium]